MVVGEFTIETGLVIIGGGPAGYAAAFHAAALGLDTTIVDERPTLGGTWLHEGCVLSKELMHVADTIRAAEHAGSFGVTFDPPRIDLPALRTRLRAEVTRGAAELGERCRDLGIRYVSGRARFDDSRQLSIANNPEVPRLRFKRALIATGARCVTLDGIDADHPRVMRPVDALDLPAVPPTLLVVGGGSIALEMAGVYAALGSRVTLVDHGERLLPAADEDLAIVVERQLETVLEEIHLRTTVREARAHEHAVDVVLETTDGPRSATFDRVLVAAGRFVDTDGLGLGRTGVSTSEAGFIVVDESLRTTDPRIFAAGDVTGRPMLTMRAIDQGRIAAEVAAGWESVFEPRATPVVVFTDPPVAWCGLTEMELRAAGTEYEVRRTQETSSDRATGLDRAGGFTKIIYDRDTQLILGLAVAGRGAADAITEGVLAIEMGAVTTDLAATLHPHPSAGAEIASLARDADSASASPPDDD